MQGDEEEEEEVLEGDDVGEEEEEEEEDEEEAGEVVSEAPCLAGAPSAVAGYRELEAGMHTLVVLPQCLVL